MRRGIRVGAAFWSPRPPRSRSGLCSIEVTLPFGMNMTQLVSRAVQGNAATDKVELVKSINGTLTAYLTFNLTNVGGEGFDDSYSTTSPSGLFQDGAEKIALRYEAMTMSCIQAVQAELSFRHLGVTTYSYTDGGIQDKSPTYCFPSCTSL